MGRRFYGAYYLSPDAWPTREDCLEVLAPSIVATCRSVLNTSSPARSLGQSTDALSGLTLDPPRSRARIAKVDRLAARAVARLRAQCKRELWEADAKRRRRWEADPAPVVAAPPPTVTPTVVPPRWTAAEVAHIEREVERRVAFALRLRQEAEATSTTWTDLMATKLRRLQWLRETLGASVADGE